MLPGSEIEDCTQEWTFAPESMDYIHMRWLIGSIVDWTELFKQAYKVLKPGGYVESYEPGARIESDDGTVKDTDAMGQWGMFFAEGGKKIGRPFEVLEEGLQRKGMEAAGFVDIEERDYKASTGCLQHRVAQRLTSSTAQTPLGSWPEDPKLKEIGRYEELVIEQDTEGYILFIASTIGWTRDEILVYIAKLRREVKSGKHHGYYKQKVVWGRKPESA